MIATCPECHADFDRVVPHQQRCGKADCERAATRRRVREYRAKHRKGGGGGGGNGGGGGGIPTLFDTITPQSADAFVPIPVIGPKESDRKPPVGVTPQTQALKAAA